MSSRWADVISREPRAQSADLRYCFLRKRGAQSSHWIAAFTRSVRLEPQAGTRHHSNRRSARAPAVIICVWWPSSSAS